MQRKSRVLLLDILPEHYLFKDDGCEVSPSCLRCPLPRCKYDDPGWYQREVRDQRDQKIHRAKQAEGLSVPQLAHRFGVSQRTVFRALQRGRSEG